jgi:uncharacterized RDD family membrane protein YckC
MRCSKCGNDAVQGDTYCRHCGQLLVPPVSSPFYPYPFYPQRPEYPPAPYGGRIGALLIDGLISLLLAVPGFALLIGLVLSQEPRHAQGPDAAADMMLGAMGLYALAVLPSMAYTFCKDGLTGGASWGKRICSLRVVHLGTGQPCTVGRSCLRQILYLVNVYGIVTLIEIIMVLSRPDRRRLGDQIAGTMVIPADTEAFAPQPWPQWQAPYSTQPYPGYTPPPAPTETDAHEPPPLR